MRDRAMQTLYLLALAPVAETQADPNSYGFRAERSTADAMTQCHKVLGRRTSARWVLEGDLKACFDRISHDWLVAHVPLDKAMLHTWLKAGYMDKHVLHPTRRGRRKAARSPPSPRTSLWTASKRCCYQVEELRQRCMGRTSPWTASKRCCGGDTTRRRKVAPTR